MKRDDGSRAEAHSESLWKSQRTLMCARVNSIPTEADRSECSLVMREIEIDRRLTTVEHYLTRMGG